MPNHGYWTLKYFNKLKNEKYVICRICKAIVKYDKAWSDMRLHLTFRHPDVKEGVKNANFMYEYFTVMILKKPICINCFKNIDEAQEDEHYEQCHTNMEDGTAPDKRKWKEEYIKNEEDYIKKCIKCQKDLGKEESYEGLVRHMIIKHDDIIPSIIRRREHAKQNTTQHESWVWQFYIPKKVQCCVKKCGLFFKPNYYKLNNLKFHSLFFHKSNVTKEKWLQNRFTFKTLTVRHECDICEEVLENTNNNLEEHLINHHDITLPLEMKKSWLQYYTTLENYDVTCIICDKTIKGTYEKLYAHFQEPCGKESLLPRTEENKLEPQPSSSRGKKRKLDEERRLEKGRGLSKDIQDEYDTWLRREKEPVNQPSNDDVRFISHEEANKYFEK